jgi:hypothetical protein
MAYSPLFFPADQLPLTAGATITGGQVVYVSAANTVSPTAGANAAWVGIAAHDAASGAPIVVYKEGVHTVAASGAIAAGANVCSAAAGAVADFAAGTNYAQVIGVALTAAASSLVTILIR